MNFSLYYRKSKNEKVFQTLEKSNFGVNKLQNYVPIYDNFFSLNDSNYKSINLNSFYLLDSIKTITSSNTFEGIVLDVSNNGTIKDVFCKFSPLLDPLKYLTGKYESDIDKLNKLPSFNSTDAFPKLLEKNNSSYVDAFFTYLSSQLLHHFKIPNCIDYYGSYLCNQEKFKYDIADDIEYLNDSDYFHNNKDKLFSIENKEHEGIFNEDSRNNKKTLTITETVDDIKLDVLDETDFKVFREDNSCPVLVFDFSNSCIFDNPNVKSRSSSMSSSSSCSSKSSNTSIDELEDGEESDMESDESSEDELEIVNCNIFDFPTQMILLEKCDNTLDYLMNNDLITNKEWTSCLCQVIMTLIIYQKCFHFTHNDLHSNNVMYIETDKKFLYYCINNKYYKIPTYGKIYKIIDFGRAIYRFNNKIICSDSFDFKGDAASQYNCEPYFDEKKPRLEPNYSFDLCRLSCCIFDYFVEDMSECEEIMKENKIVALLHSWLIDDKGRNILYKNNGEERYLEFKLYKMIARTIHNAVPLQQLECDIFDEYVISKKKINKSAKIIYIDSLPVF